jgi:hypothetical protein
MLPSQLKPESFAAYPPEARAFATEHLATLRQMPLALLPSFLNEASSYDWKLPAERAQIVREMQCLSALTSVELASRMQAFAALRLSADLESADWVNVPSAFLEQLTAWLWSTHQMDAFHAAADAYTRYLADAAPVPPPVAPRLAIVIVGRGLDETSFSPFRKLRPHGTFFNRVKPENGVEIVLAHAAARARASDQPFAHWYIDGGASSPATGLTQVSYDALAAARTALLDRTQQTIASGNSGPEALRSMLAQMKPEDIGLSPGASPSEAILNRFQLSLLTQGSGTQIFSTTFVQWAGRECLRRAQPETLVLRYAPRQQQQTMNAMLSGAPPGGLDPEGSLVDADMGAYYTWLNLRRLTGAEDARFLVWFEGHTEALAIAPGLPRGTNADSALDMKGLLALLA